MPSKCDCGCGVPVCAPRTYFKACRARLSAQGIPCPANVLPQYYIELRLAVQQHGPQQKAKRATAAAGLVPKPFQPLLPHMQQKLDLCAWSVCVCERETHTERERERKRVEKKIKIIQLNSSFGPPEARQPLLQGTQCEGNWRLRHFQRRISPLDSKHCLWLQDFQRRISPLDSKHYFWLQDFLIFMSCHQILTDKVYSNQSHSVVTFFHARRKILPKLKTQKIPGDKKTCAAAFGKHVACVSVRV